MPANLQIDRYELRGLLGHGAMGRVYRAWDTKLGRDVALKLVSRDADAKARERFHREVCAIAALRHPNIIEIYDYSGPHAADLYYVMEKLEGDDLFNLVHAHGPLPEPAAAVVGHELCLALATMHDAGVIHRDLKPENVFLDPHGRVVLTDFGIVKAVRDNSVVDGFDAKTEVIGTPGFMAPELLAGKALGPYTDIFGLGALLYNLVTGDVPFTAESPLALHQAILSGGVLDPRERTPHVSEALAACLERCLAARPKDRPQTVHEVRRALKSILEAYEAADLREELRQYWSAPAVYAEAVRQRAARRLARELADAIAARDSSRARALQRRLLQVDPDGTERLAVEALVDEQGGLSASRPKARSRRPRRKIAYTAAFAASLAMAVALTLAFGGLPRQRPEVTETAEVAEGVAVRTIPVPLSPASPAPAASFGTLEVRLAGRAPVAVSGERLAPAELKSKRLPPGRYRVEVGAGRGRLAVDVEIVAGRRALVVADVKRRRISVQ